MGTETTEKVSVEREVAAWLEDGIALFVPEVDKDSDACPVNTVAGEDTVIITVKPKSRAICAMLIGKEGRMAQSLRTMVNAIGRAQGKRYMLELKEPEEGRERREREGRDRAPREASAR